jgi:sulfate/thiosulfate transport system ATP-binding protein
MSISIQNVSKRFRNFTALDNVSIEIPHGQLVGLLGPSGSGKTTLLRIIAGLEQPDSGSVFFHGKDQTATNVAKRKVGFVFQHYALFRHMTIFDNVAFGLTVRPAAERPTKDEIRARVEKLLKMIQLDWCTGRYPHQLSGGQRQRIALARALAVEPQVLLLDEPFGALDAKVRSELRRWLRRLHDDTGITSVFVTHDQEEALEVSDRVVVINQGRVEQEGSPEEVYHRPLTPFVHHFLGVVNVFHGRVAEGQANLAGVSLPVSDWVHDEQAVAYVRPHDIEVSRVPNAVCHSAAVITAINAVGPLVRIELERRDHGDERRERIEAHIARARQQELELKVGEPIHFGFIDFQIYPRTLVPEAPATTST